MAGLLPTSNATLFYRGVKEEKLANRELIVPSGGTLGGGSSINLLMYSRAQRDDFEAWGVPGWSTDELIPYMKKLETYVGPGSDAVHGYDGPIVVSEGTYRANRSTQDFIDAASQIGYPEIEDLSGLDFNNGVQRALHYIGTNGLRQGTAYGYVHPKIASASYPNLHVLVDSQVKRVTFQGKKASGVEYKPKSQPDSTLRIVKARKMVILSCGALGTPPVMERFGLGNPDVLKAAGIDVKIDLPGVGENYQDHHLMTYPYYTNLYPNETLDALISGRLNATEQIQQNASILGWNAQDVGCKLRPTDAEVAALGQAFQETWDKEYKDHPNKPLLLSALVNFFPADPSLVPEGQYLTSSVFTGYPLSRGSIHVTGPEIDDQLNFKTGFFSDPKEVDILKHVWAYKTQREIFRRMKAYRGEVESFHPAFLPGSGAALVKLDEAPSGDIPKIKYTAEDDEAIKDWLRKNVGTTWHSLGTCAMAPREEKGTVDCHLNVYGVEGLKIADMSIPPQNVAANTMNTAIVVGEKAADIIIKEMGL
ncbi:GMC oxidoreductase [Amniculicola lignicola CBS 123094]|uniref:GMC oxidoreductase n=1 Tax=Amniculicola lignicola CBS 123094 TaxID=1392246 RepID=A0A6A5WBF9_9PLEO|nr:GMC oxidoreductase [Amniculicola lignicola CBS 123094]